MRSFHTTNFLVRKPQALPMWTAPIQGFYIFFREVVGDYFMREM